MTQNKRKRNTTRNGKDFSRSEEMAVWKKGKIVQGQDPDRIRRDLCGAIMRREEYGNTDSQYGWEIDHVKPVAKGGTDDLSNLQPLQWDNNRCKGDTYPWDCRKATA